MEANLSVALELIRRLEGGYVHDRHDPGGCTNMGITLATYRAHLNPGGACADLKKLTWEQAADLYRRRFWQPLHAEHLPTGVDLFLFDCAVHAGLGRVPPLVRAALRALRVDLPAADALDATALAALRAADPDALVRELVVARLAWLRGLKTWPRFERGWTRRVLAVRDAAYALIDQQKKTQEPRR